MNTILYTIIAIVAIALIVVVAFYAAKKRKEEKLRIEREKAETEEKINAICNQIGEEVISKASYLQEALLGTDHYFTDSECKKFEAETKELFEQLDFLRCNGALLRMGEAASHFYEQRKNLAMVRTKHNEAFIEKELTEKKEFFDSVLSYPLDVQQRDSIVKLEDNCLVISSAGSGKTSTMIGKLLYLVHQRKVQPSRILTITYTHKASDELTQRLMGTGLSCMTFHKLAMTIVAKVEGKMPTIADNGLYVKVFYDQLKKPEFRTAVLNYLTDYKSLVKNEHDYDDSVEYYRDRRKYGVIALYNDKDNRLIAKKVKRKRRFAVI
ncbi:MAG: UvrD-helicase domain-containing protein [Bacteroidales bacterium]|nr:UvrD-helicase domain-containing protein [Bacteroidales bacterium]